MNKKELKIYRTYHIEVSSGDWMFIVTQLNPITILCFDIYQTLGRINYETTPLAGLHGLIDELPRATEATRFQRKFLIGAIFATPNLHLGTDE
jgi:hypothetical protein